MARSPSLGRWRWAGSKHRQDTTPARPRATACGVCNSGRLLLVRRPVVAYPPTSSALVTHQRGDRTVSITADPPRTAARPTNVRHLVLAALLVITVINYVQRNCISPLATTIQEDLEISGQWGDQLIAAFFWAYTA